ncbi:flagellar hook capping FlgD N-terminal domain-containing protein [uncultured Algimonas sp.]|uniref:flagellar hook assembly protein FlgD n=1 Tax=uncultured Algimonas sp. TaxID=1547920 RepID=UPI0026077269|nr:flagellar hook capping FlgD N-terminal domain-containing protein [uncultured Algimonas sp.]
MDFSPLLNSTQKPPAAPASPAGTPAGNTPPSTSGSQSRAEDFDTFLNLLTAQIRNQDPLEPLDSTQFVEQLATFSGLELQAKSNTILEGIANLLSSQINSGPAAPNPTEPANDS